MIKRFDPLPPFDFVGFSNLRACDPDWVTHASFISVFVFMFACC